jgi:phosphoglycolate phosphatase-like HAD superfamily hydrolase
MKSNPGNALSFGDRDIDIIASAAAGVKSVACLWGSEDPESLKKANPNYIIHHPDEIIPLIHDVLR